jgi:hypothetical protein
MSVTVPSFTYYDPQTILQENTDALLSLLKGNVFRDGSQYYQPQTFDPNSNPPGEASNYTIQINGATTFFGTTDICDVSPETVVNSGIRNYLPSKLIGNVYKAYIIESSIASPSGQLLCESSWNYNTSMYPDTGYENPISFWADTVRLGMRLSKDVFANVNSSVYRIDEVVAVLKSATEYLFYVYMNNGNAHTLSNLINIYALNSQDTNDPTTVMPMVCSIDALQYADQMFTNYSMSDDPRIYYLPNTIDTNSLLYDNVNTITATTSGYISYMDLYGLYTTSPSDPTSNRTYPFFNIPGSGGAQQAGLGMACFLMTNEAMASSYNLFQTYLFGDTTTITTSQYTDIEVYSNSSHTTTENIVDNIVKTYWQIAFLGEFFGYPGSTTYGTSGSSNQYKPYLMQVMIDNVNVSGLVSSVAVWDRTYVPVDQSADCDNAILFDIYTCADTGWTPLDSGTPGVIPAPVCNYIGPTLEIVSYQMIVAAATGNFPIFCALHRGYYYLLYVQNGTPEGGVMGDANTPTYADNNGTVYPSTPNSTIYYGAAPPGAENTPIFVPHRDPTTGNINPTPQYVTPYVNRRMGYQETYSSPTPENPDATATVIMLSPDGSNKGQPWQYVSYCAGFQPYINFVTKKEVVTPSDITKPIFYMANPYYKYTSGMYSATDADSNVCLAYKLAHLASTRTDGVYADFGEKDTLIPSNTPQEVRNKVGSDVTWFYMYTQVKNTMLAPTGHQCKYADGDPTSPTAFSDGPFTGPSESSNFYVGEILEGKHLTTLGHDTQYGTELHPDYIDLGLYTDWVNEASAPCFLEGTKILTTRGYVPVEELQRDDQVVSCGDIRDNRYCERKDQVVPIRWVGKYTKLKPIRKHQPICITKDAFCMGMPFEEVHLSGNHGVVLFGKLVPLKRLVNDSTVYRVPVDKAVYYHVEVDGHQCILANGVRAETYLERGKRRTFTTVFSNP